MVVPGDTAGGRYVSNLVDLTVGQAPVPAKGPGGVSTEFTLSGVLNPGTYTLSSLAALPAVQLTATYKAGGTPVTDTYTGVSLWTLLNDAELITDPTIKNDVLREYVEAIWRQQSRGPFHFTLPAVARAISRGSGRTSDTERRLTAKPRSSAGRGLFDWRTTKRAPLVSAF